MPRSECYQASRGKEKAWNILRLVVCWVAAPLAMERWGQSWWQWLRDVTAWEETAIFAALLLGVSNVFFLTFVSCFALLDLWSGKEFLQQHKIQERSQATTENYIIAYSQALFNTLFVSLPYGMFYIYYAHPLVHSTSAPCALGASLTPDCSIMPSWTTVVVQFVGFAVMHEVLFFISHRLVHARDVFGFNLYKLIHKRHHTFQAPFAVAAVYAHPIEHVLANITPLATGPIVLGAHPFVATWWFVFGLFSTACVHSGYTFSWMPSARFHDWHHERFEENYGSMGLMDWLAGTSKKWRDLEHSPVISAKSHTT